MTVTGLLLRSRTLLAKLLQVADLGSDQKSPTVSLSSSQLIRDVRLISLACDVAEYKGKWFAPLIDNPDYKGPWAPRKISYADIDCLLDSCSSL